jgi:hypothetical protein
MSNLKPLKRTYFVSQVLCTVAVGGVLDFLDLRSLTTEFRLAKEFYDQSWRFPMSSDDLMGVLTPKT